LLPRPVDDSFLFSEEDVRWFFRRNWTAGSLEFFRAMPQDPDHKYVHMMHLDGFRPDLFKALLDANKLPHFQFIGRAWKVHYRSHNGGQNPKR